MAAITLEFISRQLTSMQTEARDFRSEFHSLKSEFHNLRFEFHTFREENKQEHRELRRMLIGTPTMEEFAELRRQVVELKSAVAALQAGAT